MLLHLKRYAALKVWLAVGFLMASFSSQSFATMLSTQTAIESSYHESLLLDKSRLIELANQEELQSQLAEMGVQPEALVSRISQLTPEEIAELNQRLQEMPAGASIGGAILFVFIVFVVTDMLCATNLFSFIKCINPQAKSP